MDQNATDFISVNFNKDHNQKQNAQIVIYQGKPLFFVRGSAGINFAVITHVFKEKIKENSNIRGNAGAICQFNSIHNRKID